MEIVNRKAKHDYTFIDTYSAGIQLFGSEVKAIKEGKCSINGCYCYIHNGELFIKDSYVKFENNYDKANPFKILNYWDEQRPRKLLLHKKEINKLYKESQNPGYTIVLYKLYMYNGLIKAEIALAKGKHEYDKRNTIKERDSKRELDRCIKNY